MTKDEFVEEIDVTPDKKILRSIATDIDLKRGILELVDDAIDEYQVRRKPNLKVELRFDVKNKTLSYEDDVGGIKEENMSMVIQPGGTTRTPDQTTIGEFGLGLKRAIVALSREAEVMSRFDSLDTFKIIVDDSWIASKSWKIRKYKLKPDIQPGSTVINITKLKFDINPQIVSEVRTLLGQTYGLLLSTNLTVWVDGDRIEPIRFDGWSYPPEGRHPRTYKTTIKINGRNVNVDITVGLMLKSHPAGEYAFDIYCNDRLILKDYKAPEIGFMTNLLGRPHPAISWFRGIVRITGQNQDMPWNSTKSGLDFANQIVSTLKANLLKLSKPYTRLSRRFDGDSQAQIVPYSNGTIETVDLTASQEFTLRPDQMPSIPPRARSEAERVMNLNKQAMKERPWTRALIENFHVADMILDMNLENKNRFALILLDSCLEIAFRDYLIRVKNINVGGQQREMIHRDVLVKMMKKNSELPEDMWKSIDYFYELRCPLYHQLASPEVTDTDIENFRDLVSTILFSLHGLAV